jgi:hypothetical protein
MKAVIPSLDDVSRSVSEASSPEADNTVHLLTGSHKEVPWSALRTILKVVM